MNDSDITKCVDDFNRVLGRVTASVPRIMHVRREEDFNSTVETLELSPSDYKEIATTIYIQLQRDAAKVEKSMRAASPEQIKYVEDLMTKYGPKIAQKVVDYLDFRAKSPKELTSIEASELLDAVTPLVRR